MQDTDDNRKIRTLRPAIYLRVSTEDQWNKYWLQLQEEIIRSFIKNRVDYDSHSDIPIYIDSWVSWTIEFRKRPELNRLFDDIKYSPEWTVPFDIVVVYKIDRFARDLKVLLEIIEELDEYNIAFASTQEFIDTSTPFGKAMLWILWVFAELDRDMIVQKTQEWLWRALLDGVWYRPKFWYRKDKGKRAVIYKEQAEIVKRIFLLHTEQQFSISKICEVLSSEKILIPKWWDNDSISMKRLKDVYRWNDKTVRDLLCDESYIWKYYFNKTKKVKDKATWKVRIVKIPKSEWQLSPREHAPIVDLLTFNKSQDLLEQKRWNFRISSDYVLWWLLKCDCCKGDKTNGMVSWTWCSSNWCKFYICSWKNAKKYPHHTCCTVPIPKDELESIVKHQMKDIILHPEIIERHIDKTKWYLDTQDLIRGDIEKLNKIIDNLNGKYQELEAVFLNWNSKMSWSHYANLRHELSEKIATEQGRRTELQIRLWKSIEQEKQIKAIDYVKKSIANIEDIFSDDEWCKELFNVLIDNIVVYSEVDETIRITWRKKEWWVKQAIPKWIIINFKLPQEFLNDVFMWKDLRNDLREP